MEDNKTSVSVRFVIMSILLLFGALGVSAQPECRCCGFVRNITFEYLATEQANVSVLLIPTIFGTDSGIVVFQGTILPSEQFEVVIQEADLVLRTVLLLIAALDPLTVEPENVIGFGFLELDCAEPLAIYTAIGYEAMKGVSFEPIAEIVNGTYVTEEQEVLTLCTIFDDCTDVSQEATTIPATFERYNTSADCRTDAQLLGVFDTRIPIDYSAPCLNLELQNFLFDINITDFNETSLDDDAVIFLGLDIFDLILYGDCNSDNSITATFLKDAASVINLQGDGECCRSYTFLPGIGSVFIPKNDSLVSFKTSFNETCFPLAVCDYPPNIAFSRNTLKCIGTPFNEICDDWICDYGLEPFGEALCTAYGSWDTSRAVCGCKHGPPVPFAEDYHNSYCQEVPVGKLCFDWSCKNGLSAFGSAECTPTGWDITDAHCGCDSSPKMISYAISTSDCVGTPAGEACDEWTCEPGKLVSGKAICLGDSSWFTGDASCTGCVVSDWSDWSDCSATCGEGTRTRHRSIVLEDETVDVQMLHCPPLMEDETCDLGSCSKAASTSEDDVTIIALACAVGVLGLIIVAGVLSWLSPKRRRLRQEDVFELEFHPR